MLLPTNGVSARQAIRTPAPISASRRASGTGIIDTPIFRATTEDLRRAPVGPEPLNPDMLAGMVTPMKRAGQAADIAAACAYLARECRGHLGPAGIVHAQEEDFGTVITHGASEWLWGKMNRISA